MSSLRMVTTSARATSLRASWAALGSAAALSPAAAAAVLMLAEDGSDVRNLPAYATAGPVLAVILAGSAARILARVRRPRADRPQPA